MFSKSQLHQKYFGESIGNQPNNTNLGNEFTVPTVGETRYARVQQKNGTMIRVMETQPMLGIYDILLDGFTDQCTQEWEH